MTRTRLTLIAIVAAVGFGDAAVHGSENLEVVTGGGSVISHRLWRNSAFPLGWQLHEDGVVNNNALGLGTPAITNAQAVTELSEAFQAWADTSGAALSVTHEGETTVADSGCDLVNIVTWSDTTQTWGSSTIARGITTMYTGPDLVLDDSNRGSVACGDGDPSTPDAAVALPASTYPNGSALAAGTILDMDMTWNPAFDYVTAPNTTFSVLDIQAVATHEFGHLFGVSHVSLTYAGDEPSTMFPIVDSTDVGLQTNLTTLSQDDAVAARRAYPAAGHWPSGTAPYTTGAIAGSVRQASGVAAQGVRVWAHSLADTGQPSYEAFTLTQFDWDPALQAGDYVIEGMAPGDYYVCIVPWSNGVHSGTSSNPARYNLTTNNGAGHTGFPTECYDDAQTATAAPEFGTEDVLRRVTVTAGATTPSVDFVTGAQESDIVLVMDRSGSMLLPAGGSGSGATTKLQALQSAANAFVDYLELDGGHRLGLVQFEENLVPFSPAFGLQNLTGGATGSATAAHTAIDSMSAGGLTNIIAGVGDAVSQLTAGPATTRRQVVVLFSDGKHNRPLGSSVTAIETPLVDNDITLYSVGFGTDIDSGVLAPVATATGGNHVDEPSLGALALTKHFLSIAASAADNTALVDPRFAVAAGGDARLQVPVAPGERALVFAVAWETRDRSRIGVTVTTPGGCQLSTDNASTGLRVRRGDTYQIVSVPLPLACKQRDELAGTWEIRAIGAGVPAGATEQVEIIAFGASDSRLVASARWSKREGTTVLARWVDDGRVVRDTGEMKMLAEIVVPVPPTGDSERQDKAGRDGQPGTHAPAGPTAPTGPVTHVPSVPTAPSVPRQQTLRVELFDDGKHGDGRPGDGVFGAALAIQQPGAYRVRVIAHRPAGGQKLQRESLVTFYFDGARAAVPKAPSPRKLRTAGHYQ